MAKQEAYLETGDLSEFDATSPAWDNTADAVADFDSEVDADGDLNDHATEGMEITFDDANTAYGVLNADAVDQTSGVISFWFDPNDVAIESGKIVYLVLVRDGGGDNNWGLRIRDNEGVIQARTVYTPDGGVLSTLGSWVSLGSDFTKIDVHFSASTGAGNDDGWVRMYVNDVLETNGTGLDNDTRDWDLARFGMCYTNSTTFGGSFYMKQIKIDPVGAPMVDTLSAQSGTYGLTIPIMDTTNRYVQFDNPNNEGAVTIECVLDPNTITIPDTKGFAAIRGHMDAAVGGTAAALFVQLNYNSPSYELAAGYYTDAGSLTNLDTVTITDAPHTIKVVWKASSGAGNDDGYYRLYVDGVLKAEATGLDTDQRLIDKIFFGASAWIDAGTYGIIHMDNIWAEFPTVKTLTINDSDGNSLGSIEPTDATIIFQSEDNTFAFDLTELT